MAPYSLKKIQPWLLLWTGFLLVSLLSRPLLPVDETRYLSVAWEMWEKKQFLIPLSNGLAYSHKPPLLFWLIHLGWWVFGVNQWSARLTAPFFGLGCIILAVRLAKLLWPAEPEVSRAVPYVLMSMCVWSVFGTLTMFDMPIAFFALAAYLGCIQVIRTGKTIYWISLSSAVGLGLLAKGPVILIYVMPPALLAPWWSNSRILSKPLWYLGVMASLAGGFLLALAWAIPAVLHEGPAYARAIFFDQTAGRLISAFAHQRPFYWYIVLAPLIFFPWSFSLSFWRGIKKIQIDSAMRFCLSAIIPGFLLLSCISGKQLHYILPLMPPAALLLSKVIIQTRPNSYLPSRVIFVSILSLTGMVLFLLPHLPLDGGDGAMLADMPAWIGMLPISGAIVLLYILPEDPGKQIRIIAIVNILLVTTLQLAISPILHKLFEPASIFTAMRAAAQEGHILAVAPEKSGDHILLSDQFQFSARLTGPLPVKNNLTELIRWAKKNKNQYCLLFTRSNRPELLKGRGIAASYKGGWLIFSPARELAGVPNNLVQK